MRDKLLTDLAAATANWNEAYRAVNALGDTEARAAFWFEEIRDKVSHDLRPGTNGYYRPDMLVVRVEQHAVLMDTERALGPRS